MCQETTASCQYELLTSEFQQVVKNSVNQSDPEGTATFTVVRAGVTGDVTVYWSLGLDAALDFYLPLHGSLFFRSVII